MRKLPLAGSLDRMRETRSIRKNCYQICNMEKELSLISLVYLAIFVYEYLWFTFKVKVMCIILCISVAN